MGEILDQKVRIYEGTNQHRKQCHTLQTIRGGDEGG